MNRRDFLKGAALGVAAGYVGTAGVGGGELKRPNVLVFMTDQQRSDTVVPGTRMKAITPVLDEFRKRGMTFTNAHCPSPHCCPSRATFFTGLYPSEHGVWNNVNVPNALSRGLNPWVRPWSLDLAASGYRLRFSGKWHVSNWQTPADFGWNQPSPPARAGEPAPGIEEQEREATTRGWAWLKEHWTIGSEGDQRRPGEIVRHGYVPFRLYGTNETPFRDAAVVQRAIGMMNEAAKESEPWMLYCGTLGPHDPYTPPQRFLDLYKDTPIELPPSFRDEMADKPALYRRTRGRFAQLSDEEQREAIRHYLAFCSYEDHLFGRLLEALDKTGQAENTVVVYLSDHGDYAAEHGLWTKGLPCFRAAYNIPLVVAHPAMPRAVRGTTCDAFVETADFAPTIMEWTGTSCATAFSGRSLTPLLNGRRPADWRDAVCFQTNGNETYGIQRSVLTDRWRFVFNAYDYDELYDLESDPDQITNLAADPEYADEIEALYARIWKFALAHQDQLTDTYITTAMASWGPGLAWLDE